MIFKYVIKFLEKLAVFIRSLSVTLLRKSSALLAILGINSTGLKINPSNCTILDN